MKKNRILAIVSSPRKGNSTYAAKKSLKNFKGKKTIIDINKLDIKPCKACFKCAEKLKCVYDDDAPALISLVGAADMVIVASPVYFTGVPGPLKIFIDRNQVQWKKHISQKSKVKSQRVKKGIIILTAGSNKAKYFRPAESEIRSFFAVNGIKTVSVLKFGGMDEKGEMKKQKAKLKKTAKAFARHG